VTECDDCQTRNIYRFNDDLCCWVRFIRGLPIVPDKDGLTTQAFWIDKLQKRGLAALAGQIKTQLED